MPGDGRVIDLHCHAMPPDLAGLVAELEGPGWPVLRTEGDRGRVERDGEVFRIVRPPCWDLDRRIEEMDEAGVAIQVLSPIPVSLTYGAAAGPSLRYAQHVNDWLAAQVQRAGGRLEALGTVPLQDPDLAIGEMERARRIGLAGLEIGTSVGSDELDAPRLRPFFRAAAASGTPLFVHPTDGRCVGRATAPRLHFGLGMTTDTGLAASALVLGGVLAECPELRVCLAHGGGAYTWAEPRITALPWDDGMVAPPDRPQIYVDCLVFDPHLIPVLRHRYGADRLVLGSDHPFLPGRIDPAVEVDRAVELGLCSPAEASAIREGNAWRFLGRGDGVDFQSPE